MSPSPQLDGPQPTASTAVSPASFTMSELVVTASLPDEKPEDGQTTVASFIPDDDSGAPPSPTMVTAFELATIGAAGSDPQDLPPDAWETGERLADLNVELLEELEGGTGDDGLPPLGLRKFVGTLDYPDKLFQGGPPSSTATQTASAETVPSASSAIPSEPTSGEMTPPASFVTTPPASAVTTQPASAVTTQPASTVTTRPPSSTATQHPLSSPPSSSTSSSSDDDDDDDDDERSSPLVSPTEPSTSPQTSLSPNSSHQPLSPPAAPHFEVVQPRSFSDPGRAFISHSLEPVQAGPPSNATLINALPISVGPPSSLSLSVVPNVTRSLPARLSAMRISAENAVGNVVGNTNSVAVRGSADQIGKLLVTCNASIYGVLKTMLLMRNERKTDRELAQVKAMEEREEKAKALERAEREKEEARLERERDKEEARREREKDKEEARREKERDRKEAKAEREVMLAEQKKMRIAIEHLNDNNAAIQKSLDTNTAMAQQATKTMEEALKQNQEFLQRLLSSSPFFSSQAN
ncbi:hypothetical protein ONZ45_g13949 [Pleurotus djamor]|nr:hypothetical protein ONZ45_g13949 [Pleurotus djamor]